MRITVLLLLALAGSLSLPALAGAPDPDVVEIERLSDTDAARLARAEMQAGTQCLSEEYSPVRSVTCREWDGLREQLLLGGWCPRILESSVGSYRSEWTRCWREAKPYAAVRDAIRRVDELVSACRGLSEETEPGRACDQVSVASRALDGSGWCDARADEPGAFNTWHACEPDSLGGPQTILELGYRLNLWSEPEAIELNSNLLESTLEIPLFLGRGFSRENVGFLTVQCGQVEGISLLISLSGAKRYLALAENTGEESGALAVSVRGGHLDEELMDVVATYFASNNTFFMEITEPAPVREALLDLYRDGSLSIRFRAVSPEHLYSTGVHVGGTERKSRNAIANMAAACAAG